MNAFFHALVDSLQPFHHLQPAGWFAWRALFGPRTALAAAALGLFCLVVGSRAGVFRFVAVPLAALLGVALSPSVLALTHGTAIPDRAIALGLPLALGLLAGFVPHTVAFVSLGALGALAGMSVVSEHELLVGAVPGFFFAGVLGVVFAGVVDAVAAAAFGAMLLTGGFMQAFPSGPLYRLLVAAAWAPAALALALTAVGAGLQLWLWSDPEARSKKRVEEREKKQRAKEARTRDARFSNYAKRG